MMRNSAARLLAPGLNHPQRLKLAAELHSRPFISLAAPACVSHLAIHGDEGAQYDERVLADFCVRFGVAAPAPGAQHFFHDFGHFRLKWERHTEFSTFTFIEHNVSGEAFSETPMRHVPHDWLAMLDGKVIVASHIATECGERYELGNPRLRRLFPAVPLVGSRVLGGGELWTDFLIGPDGFSRFLLRDTGLREMQLGRVVQRICEIETYVMMALLALPLARSNAALLEKVEEDVARLGLRMQVFEPAADEALLLEITQLAAKVRSMSFDSGYRFSAAQAYHRIVRARIGELREKRIEGVPTVGEFMDRRLVPAMDTCVSVAARQEALANKVSRSNDLLRTRVSIAQERQSQRVLESLSHSAAMQLRLQQAVEGLSVVAISYYGISLGAYALKALKGWGAGVNVDGVVGVLLPLVLGATWLGMRRMRHQLHVRQAPTPAQ
ncbi:DUF3422 domain-containing protein [Azoarcus sp. L1K30]|uniref:DUF3422 family protein n=1 Tax=Azoarcus sp. L1K30 TaxID=2820277 RepID=UPI0020123F84|nr:DUF3422 domain-containing protein [Azoarcus sp. L1K30]